MPWENSQTYQSTFSKLELASEREQACVNIHNSSTGDLTIPRNECTVFQQFSLPASHYTNSDERSLEVKLPQRLEIGVGGHGIIGRRISMSQHVDNPNENAYVAEGIVGFNSMLSL